MADPIQGGPIPTNVNLGGTHGADANKKASRNPNSPTDTVASAMFALMAQSSMASNEAKLVTLQTALEVLTSIKDRLENHLWDSKEDQKKKTTFDDKNRNLDFEEHIKDIDHGEPGTQL